ncbi:outer membrane beta-barrel domain-containing protein [Chondromyces crocatus]|uniref:Outer membrane beta-barrel domain-containing protein n=1 Tax=Chondromyces crocatus TaxID=52 RepID=A0A0K1EM11_CHOCO|nr:outer membrane beta-barrel domain-containing protein [Chondromyces crocatus]AKT41643.1 uncharacterized protein CMC5_058490 [Chondromyces crocatus]
MNQARVGLFMAAALLAVPLTASAQQQPKEINLDEPEAPEETPADVPVEEPADGDSGLGDICKIDPGACPSIDMDKAAARDLKEEVYAVQQIYALRRHRFEVNPYWAVTMNDQFAGHPGPGLAVNWYITNVLAVGINGNFYAGLNSVSDFNFQTSRAARVGQPITEYAWNANANFTYVPAYGKFAGFGDFIFHYDFYVVGGVGAISTRPIAVVDPDNRTFNFEPKITFRVGGGLRIFFNRWFAAMLEVSDYIFFDKLENPSIASGTDGDDRSNAQNPNTWLAEGTSFTNNVQAQVGISIFLPFTWEYRLPK